MKILKLSFFLLVLLFSSCGNDEVDAFIYSKAGSPHLITENIEGEVGQDFIVEPGAELIIYDDVFINLRGNVFIEGTEDEPVVINPQTPGIGWDKISLKGEAETLVIRHAKITDGIITSFSTNNQIENVEFIQTQPLDWSFAFIRFWFGTLEVRNCTFEGINRCDGILIHEVHDVLISDNHFLRVPDAVEFIDSRDGIMENNVIIDSNDDGVDLNASTNIIIRNNYFEGIADAAMEIGSENFGSSMDVITQNNRMENCFKGIWLKESSSLHAIQDSFYNCAVGVDVVTDDDSIRISSIILESCEFLGNALDIQQDDRSEVEVIN